MGMEENYFNYLNFRAAERQLKTQFARPRALLVNTLAFITAMTAMWYYMIAAQLMFYQDNFRLPVLIGVVWSAVLLVHAVLHYRRSPALDERREMAVEAEMRGLIEKSEFDHDSLFSMHHQLDDVLQGQGRWARVLLAFAVINALSWGVSTLNIGTSWPFQMTLPLAVIIIGGVNVFLHWQERREKRTRTWLTRLPLRHIGVYGVGVIGLAVAGMYRMVNPWDVNNVTLVWGIMLVLHIIFSVIVQPLIERMLPTQERESAPEKRKTPARLVLADDGEVVDIADVDDLPAKQRL